MSNTGTDPKRHISSPPYTDGLFHPGEFIYDPDAPWDEVRSGTIVNTNGNWCVMFPPKDPRQSWTESALSSHPGRIARHLLINQSGFGPLRGPVIDTTPWETIAQQIRTILRDADSHRVRLDELKPLLLANQQLDPDLLEDTMRMCASMGIAEIWGDKGGLWYGASKLIGSGFARLDYLATFSDELLAKSRRIDHLLKHTGTVGSYREELLRTTLRALLPSRFQASTGFIENSPRQLDIIVWDAERYAPLFREQDVVVVPRESVRSIIEVKTTLDTTTLDDALEILHDVLRVEPSVVPVFKGIFAFHQGYKSDLSIAERMKEFYLGAHDKLGLIARKHQYLFQGVTAVCVPVFNFVFQAYFNDEAKPQLFPRPWLLGLNSAWPGDLKTSAFLAQLLDHLDLDPKAKQTQRRMFQPIINELAVERLVDLFGENWAPSLICSELGKTRSADGALEYVKRVHRFFAGSIEPSEIAAGLEK